ncbi:unnamed protein product [Pylaiella littoralis]
MHYTRKGFKGNLIENYIETTAYPELILDNDIENIKTLKDFDDIYTSKAHGFKDAMTIIHKAAACNFRIHYTYAYNQCP